MFCRPTKIVYAGNLMGERATPFQGGASGTVQHSKSVEMQSELRQHITANLAAPGRFKR